jgi:hypothetical protein
MPVWRADTGTVRVPTRVERVDRSEIHVATIQAGGSPRRFDGLIADDLVHRDDLGVHAAPLALEVPWHVRARLGEDV